MASAETVDVEEGEAAEMGLFYLTTGIRHLGSRSRYNKVSLSVDFRMCSCT